MDEKKKPAAPGSTAGPQQHQTTTTDAGEIVTQQPDGGKLAEIHATHGNATWTTTAMADDPEAEHMRKAAMDARINQDDRSASARVKVRAEQAARAAGRGAS